MSSYLKKLAELTDDDTGKSGNNKVFNTKAAGGTIRFNSITKNDITNDFIGFQSKPGFGTDTAKNLIGAEISPRLLDGVDLTGSGSVIGLHVDTYLKGDEGDIAGDVRGQQIELVDDNAIGRTIAGNANHLRLKTNLSCAVTGKFSCIRVENEEGSKSLDAFVQFVSTAGCVTALTAGVNGAATIKVLIDGTTWHIPLSASAS